jgi:hypothetical protein
MVINRELISVLGDITADDQPPVFAQKATELLSIRETRIAVRERAMSRNSTPPGESM